MKNRIDNAIAHIKRSIEIAEGGSLPYMTTSLKYNTVTDKLELGIGCDYGMVVHEYSTAESKQVVDDMIEAAKLLTTVNEKHTTNATEGE